jgi:hypothetical protein
LVLFLGILPWYSSLVFFLGILKLHALLTIGLLVLKLSQFQVSNQAKKFLSLDNSLYTQYLYSKLDYV